MARILGFRVKNFGVLKDIRIGFEWERPVRKSQAAADSECRYPFTPLTAVIGKNGVGKSRLFDAFGFLADCLKVGVEEACDLRERGGFSKVRSIGQDGPIEFSILYAEDDHYDSFIRYDLHIDGDASNRPYVDLESVGRLPRNSDSGRRFLFLHAGKGLAWPGAKGEAIPENEEGIDHEHLMELVPSMFDKQQDNEFSVELEDPRKLGIATFGSLKEHPVISAFRNFIEGWHLSYFTPDAARGLPLAGPQRHLNVHGDNLANVVQHMERENPALFRKVLTEMAEKIPGIDKIEAKKSEDGRLLLCFNDKGFKDPFYAQQMSDGTLKMFAYLLLLEDPKPPSFLCIEEPENGLHHKLLEELADEFREHAEKKGGSQVFVTTHQPHLLDALEPNEVWVLEKGADGFATITPAAELPYVQEMVNQGLPLGSLWFSDYLDKR